MLKFLLRASAQIGAHVSRSSVFARSLVLGLGTFGAVIAFQTLSQHELKELLAAQSPGQRIEMFKEARENLGEEFGGAAREAWFYKQRAYPMDEIPHGANLEANAAADELEKLNVERRRTGLPNSLNAAGDIDPNASWKALGPQPIRVGQTFGVRNAVSGRVTAIALDPRYDGANNQTVYVGGAQGGVWKSVDNGASWTAITDSLPTQAIGAIAVDPINPNVVWVGTGEANRSGDSYYGAGLFKSTDGGATWNQIVGPVSSFEPKEPVFLNCTFGAISIHPTKPDTIFVSTNVGFHLNAADIVGIVPLGNRGIWRTTDGGKTWINVNPTQNRLDLLGSDVIIDPRNPSRVYLSLVGEGIFRSDNDGNFFTWKELTKGLPPRFDKDGKRTYARIKFSIGPPTTTGSVSTIYAAIAAPNDTMVGIYRSTDAGENWTRFAAPPSGQSNYNLAFGADPNNGGILYYGTNANEAYNGGTLYRSNNAAQSWTDISLGDATGGLHPDSHVAVVSKNNSNIVFTGNDGGIWRTDNALAALPRWINCNNGLSITQFQSVAVDPYNSNAVIGGTQDNGTNAYRGNSVWEHIDDGDGGAVIIDQSNPRVLYHTYFNASFGNGAIIGPVISTNGGDAWEPRGCLPCTEAVKGNFNPRDRVAFYAPMTANTAYGGVNGNVIYFGTNRVYRTNDQGVTWIGIGPSADGFGEYLTRSTRGVVTTIASFPARGGIDPAGEVVWAGTDDGQVRVTDNAHLKEGARWFDVSKGLPNRFVSDIAIDPRNAKRAIATFSGFNRNTPSTPGHIFITDNTGATWTDISGSLPDTPLNSVILDPFKADTFYVGTDLGVFFTTDRGKTWGRLGVGLPRVAILQMRYHLATGSLVIATHGRGVYRLAVNPTGIATVSAASFTGSAITPESIVSSFGTNLASGTVKAEQNPLPTTLGGTRVFVRDSVSNERPASLFFVSPTQVNFQVPAGTASGEAMVTIINGGGQAAIGFMRVNNVAPSVFTYNANGAGVPAGLVLRIRANGSQRYEQLAQWNGSQWQSLPIDVSNTTDQVFLVLFGTGIRYNSGLNTTAVKLSSSSFNLDAPVLYAGRQGTLVGLDQVNVRIPTTANGRGEMTLQLMVEGRMANPVRVQFR